MSKPRLLDLFCGAGGAAMGYHRAGFDVVGVDIEPQPNYPFEFHQADALEYPLDGFDAIHASPPCQGYSVTAPLHPEADCPKLIKPVRQRLQGTTAAYVIENVPGAPLMNAVTLCGTQFGLRTRRHRLFETSWRLFALMPPCVAHDEAPVQVFGHGGDSSRYWTMHDWREAMGIDWMKRDELAEAIPPAYTEWIGGHLMGALGIAA